MSKCYETIKKISKKKFKEKELADLKSKLLKGWEEKIGNTDKFEEIFQTVENFAKYGFNSPHSLSMGGDSAYEAWFKAHHTSKFYEVAINHYQAKNKKDKIEALTKEAMKFYDYKLGAYKFGIDNRKVTVDDNTKIIYPSLSNIKGFGMKVAESLFIMGKDKNNYNNIFTNFLEDLKGKGINQNIIVNLIKLDYFSDFGKSQYLLNILDIYNKLNSVKQINKSKLNALDLSENMIKKYADKETKSLYKEIDNMGLINELIMNLENKDIKLGDKIQTEMECLGYVMTQIENLSKNIYYVLKIDEYKNKKSYTFYPTLYNIKTGKEIKYKISDYMMYMDYPFKVGEIINITNESKSPKKKQDENGKWKPVPNEFNNMLDGWEIY
jgi:DNA polymerase III alpha subunit